MRIATQPLIKAIINLLLPIFMLGYFSGPVLAQDHDRVKSLEELMAEVERQEQADRDDSPANPDRIPQENTSRVKTLEELMAEVEQQETTTQPHNVTKPDTIDDGSITEFTPPSDDTKPNRDIPFGLIIGIFAIIIAMVALGLPLYVLIGSLALYLLYFGGVFNEFGLLTSIIEQTRGLADQTVLLAIPFFVIAGAIMTEGDIARRLIAFAESVFGRLPGGLGIAAVFACAFFAAISGSSPVTVIAIGSIMYPALIKKNYPDNFSCGLVTSAGSLGILIPPSIPMIIYAIVDPTALKDPVGYTISSTGGGESSVKDLFLAGLGPGLLIGVALALYAMFIGYRHRVETKPFRLKEIVQSFQNGFWALFLPILILGGIYSGVFTPTQAAGVAVVYALIVELYIHRSLKFSDLPKVFSESAILMGSLFIIMSLALGFNLYLDRAKIPEQVVEFILDYQMSIITFLLLVNILLIFVGFFMDILSAILILVPLLAPIAFGLGIHPLHFAAIFIVNLEIGYLSPPIGMNLFVASTLFKKGIGTVVKSVMPFIGIMVICLLLVTYVPTISLGLVSWIKGGDFYVPFPTTEYVEQNDTPTASDNAIAPESLDISNANSAPDGVKSLEELMQQVEKDTNKQNNQEPARVKTLEELMLEVEQQSGTELP